MDSRIKIFDYESLNQEIFDFQIPICSLPNLLKISDIKEIPYYKLELSKNVGKVQVINKNKLNIGLAWSGNPNYPNDEYRSIPLDRKSTRLNSSHRT